MTPFTAEDDYLVEKFIADFEDAADVFGWNEIQKIVYGKRLCQGVAREAIKTTAVNSWGELKYFLSNEFQKTVNSARIHFLLANRQKLRDESYHAYLIAMRKFGHMGKLEDEAVIEHTINGIPDSEFNKSILYGAATMDEFRKKLELYEKMKGRDRPKQEGRFVNDGQHAKSQSVKPESKRKWEKHANKCFNCGSEGHLSKNCDKKKDGPRCFKCGTFGHISKDCQSAKSPPAKTYVLDSSSGFVDKAMKEVSICGQQVPGFVDTGSDVTVVSDQLYFRLGSPDLLDGEKIDMTGIGRAKLTSLGSFETVLTIDGDDYPVTANILPASEVPSDLLLGRDVLNQAELRIKLGEVSMVKINVLEAVDYVENLKGTQLYKPVKNLVEAYNPIKCVDSCVEMKIILKDDIPVYQNPRRLSAAENDLVNAQVEQWIEDGIVEPSSSEYASPIVLVPKKDGTKRLCVDYRQINRKIIRDRYPLPQIEDQIDRLQGAKIFTTLDLENGFFHVPVHKDSQKFTSFVTPSGQYVFRWAPFGLATSPSAFQRFINTVFRDLIAKKIMLVYMDDIVILAEDDERALQNLETVLMTAAENGLRIKWKKCQFMCSRINYLGYEIENGSLKPSAEKTIAVSRFPEPKNVRNIQEFLGLTGYFRKFISNYSIIARALTDLLRADTNFCFDFRQKEAFDALKRALCDRPVLMLYDPKAETELHTDACKYGYGATLMQKGDDQKYHPVYFYSKKTKTAEEKYCSYELEALAIVNALKKLRVYLIGLKFKIVTDCSAFKSTMSKKEICPRIARWAMVLEEYDYEMEHRTANRMRHVDGLSRNPIICALEKMIHPRIKAAQHNDRELRAIFEVLKTQKYENYVTKNDILYVEINKELRLVVPKGLQAEIIKDCHEQGHFGVRKTQELLEREFWMPKMKPKIQSVLACCVTCILATRKGGKAEGFLHPIPKGGVPLDTYHLDHVGKMTATNKNYQYVLTIVDAFTKFVWIYPTKGPGVEEVIRKLDQQQSIFSNPRRFITDRGSAFTSTVFDEYCTKNNIEHIAVTTGVPRGNGQIENVNGVVINCMAKLSIEKPENWWKFANRVQRFINNSVHRSTNKTPFELMFGVRMRTEDDLGIQAIIEEELQKIFDDERNELREAAKVSIQQIQQENRRSFNKKRKPAFDYKVGDLVAIKRTQFGSGLKIAKKFLGPYEIIKINFPDRYDVVKVGSQEGPKQTSTCAEYMKPFAMYENETDVSSDEDEAEETFGPNV